MVGVILIVIALLVVLPVSILVSGGALAGVISFFVQKDVDDHNEGSEFLDLNG